VPAPALQAPPIPQTATPEALIVKQPGSLWKPKRSGGWGLFRDRRAASGGPLESRALFGEDHPRARLEPCHHRSPWAKNSWQAGAFRVRSEECEYLDYTCFSFLLGSFPPQPIALTPMVRNMLPPSGCMRRRVVARFKPGFGLTL